MFRKGLIRNAKWPNYSGNLQDGQEKLANPRNERRSISDILKSSVASVGGV